MIHHSIFYIYSKEGTDYSALAKLHGRRGEENLKALEKWSMMVEFIAGSPYWTQSRGGKA